MPQSKFLKSLAAFAGISLLFILKAYSQDLPKDYYIASGIPDSLKEGANSVVRYSMYEWEVKGPGKIVVKHHSLITILNEKGDREAIVEYGYNKKYDNYSFIDVHVYDESGKMIKKYHKVDMYDAAASSDETLVTDERFLYLKHSVAKYPETIEIEYEENVSSTVGIDEWRIQGDEQSVQNSYCHISIRGDVQGSKCLNETYFR